MALSGYQNIDPAATAPGSPIDGFLLSTLRQNEVWAETMFRAALASPFGPMGGFRPGIPTTVTISGAVTDLEKCYMYNAKKIVLDTALTTKAQVPLIWFATEEIELKNTITATGNGAPATKIGNFGGSGGGAAAPADATKLPVTEVVMKAGGLANAVGQVLDEFWASRVFMHLSGATGGGPGAGATGGAGGGIVILCAPKITFTGGATKIVARGADGTANCGGGGGGLVLLICHETSNVTLAKLEVNGGAGHGTAAAGVGGAGFAKIVQFT